MKKQLIAKIISVLFILWISSINIPQAQAITSENNKLSGYSEPSISVQLLRKNCFFYKGDYGVLACEQLVKSTPNDPEAWNNLGYKYYFVEEYQKALFSYQQALNLNPKYSLAWTNLCGLLSNIESYDLALQACDRALLNNSYWGSDGEALAWDNKGNILFYLGRYQESLDAFNHALAANPNYANANINRSVVLNHLKYFVLNQD